jgi:hypothetical protein
MNSQSCLTLELEASGSLASCCFDITLILGEQQGRPFSSWLPTLVKI